VARPDAPEDPLRPFFPAHAVTLTGWRLRPLVKLARQGTLSGVRALGTRYSQVISVLRGYPRRRFRLISQVFF
jgi:hypothetical protein